MFKIINVILFISTVFGQQIDYQTQIQPIFNESCTNCHGYSGGLALGNYDQLMSGGNSGDLVIPGDYQNSILWQRIDSGEMPPAGDISNDQLELIENWIMQGALEEVLKIDEMDISPDHFTLYQNYPNPFNPETTLPFYLPTRGQIRLRIGVLEFEPSKSRIGVFADAGQLAVRPPRVLTDIYQPGHGWRRQSAQGT